MPLETPLLELHRSAAAQIGEYFGTLLPANFGDFAAEYRAAHESVILADVNFKAFFSFTGPDRQRYLNAVLTSNVRDLQPGQGTVGLLLTPQGHILAEIETYVSDARILVVSHAMVRERTFATFDKFIIMDDVTLEDLTPSTGMLALIGPGSAELIASISGINIGVMPEFGHVESAVGTIPCQIIRRNFANLRGASVQGAGLPRAFLVADRDKLAALWKELEERVREAGGRPTGMEALNAIRLESGVAWFGHDYDDKQIPHEAGLEKSHISYEKGCYTGQEIVERVRSRGHANRRLTELKFLADAPPAPGTKLLLPQDAANMAITGAGAEVGQVTSAAFSPRLGRPIGLGYLRREHSTVGTRLDAAGTPAEVISPPSVVENTPA